jgi:hypothetical protein
LPEVPEALVARDARRAGRSEQEAPERKIAAGEGRHAHCLDFAVRLARAGVVDRERLLEHLRLEFRLSCEPDPPPARGFFEGLADWATKSRIAARERTDAPEGDGLAREWWATAPGEGS